MIKNYLKIAFRNLLKHKGFFLINLLGLSIGMSCCLLIFIYVNNELSYDKFHTKASQIYRLVTDVKTPTEVINADITSAPMGPNLKTDFPEVLNATRINNYSFLVQKDESQWQEIQVLLADQAIFEMFDFPLIKGNPEQALEAPFSLVLTEKIATKYFGDEDPIGKFLLLDGKFDGTVTGVVKDVPENSQIKFEILVSMSTLTEKLNPGMENQWGNFGFTTYLLLPEDYNPTELESKLPAFLENHISNEMRESGMNYTLFLEPLTDVYLYSERKGQVSGSLTNVYIFSIIAVVILVIACFNFMNLAIARSVDRAKEVGVRKVVGAGRNQLTGQFLSESILISIFSGIIALLLSEVLLPVFNEISGKIIAESILGNYRLWLLIMGLTIGTGLLAGIYPAFVLSEFKPSIVLKGRFSTSSTGLSLRKALVVFQFAISVALIVGTVVVYQQLNYMKNQDLGFKKNQMLIFNFQGDQQIQKQFQSIKNEISNIPGVTSVSASSSTPSTGNAHAYTILENKDGDMQPSNIALYFVDFNYLDNYKIPVIAGRGFSLDFPSDSTAALVVNEASAASLGYAHPEEIVGKKFSQWGREGHIIGVIKDFHFKSLKEKITPLTLRIEPQRFGLFSVAVKTSDLKGTVVKLENFFKDIAPHRPVDYYFLDEAFDKQYRAEERFGTLILYFSGLAIFIACLGLLGVTSYTTSQRTKEVGIRKVMGASAYQLVALLSKDLLRLVLAGMVIAIPVAWYGMSIWLDNFEYKTELSWWIFLVAGTLAVVIALFTVSSQAIKAALANPVKSIRIE
ncbi:ABC transporter permease [soil metagenome]